ncbi:TetR/AcrR family transcriptional regulator [Candidatus Solincola tengchongensis]|uniref:TetR/AcrR family transcriptional regulator n=1 Tax=Candidatus Solincola tengchongensis TaxID=2900693 RepID=UPI00257F51B0|nr:TetR/AcrR family transcriptional regulator [Candidatus Solincola tengchongensis]
MNLTLAERRRSEIIEAALEVFSEKGYHAAKIEDIASRLNIGHGTFYRYFKNKLDIFNHVVEDIISRARDFVSDIDPMEPNTLEEYRRQLGTIGDRLFELFKNYPQISRVLFYEAFGINDQYMQKRIREIFDLFGSFTAMYLENGVRKGYLRKDLHIRETAFAVNAALFEACRRVVSSEDPERAVEVWKETIITLMLDGMRA